MLRPRVSSIYHQGTAPYREDGLVVGTTLFGVFDGVSAPYAPKYPIRLFGGLSGGEMVVRKCERLLYNLDSSYAKTSPLEFVSMANERMMKAQKHIALELDLPSVPVEELAGTTFAVAHLSDTKVEIAQAGNVLAIIEMKNGDIVFAPNQVRGHDMAMNAEIERIQRKVALETLGLRLEDVPDKDRGLVRGEMWNRFYHILREARRQDANNSASPRRYGILNGDPMLEKMVWERSFDRKDISTIVLCTDGVIPWPVMKATDDDAIAAAILDEYHRRGVAGLLFAARGIEEQNVATSYTNQAEATAVALQF